MPTHTQFFASTHTTRLLLSLVVHPMVLEAAEALSRASAADSTAGKLDGGKLTFTEAKILIIQSDLQAFPTKLVVSTRSAVLLRSVLQLI